MRRLRTQGENKPILNPRQFEATIRARGFSDTPPRQNKNPNIILELATPKKADPPSMTYGTTINISP